MTLFKQIATMLSIFLLVILTTVLILNFQSASNGVKERLYEDAKNTATSLSLSLGSANGDISMMSTMINANFDSGSYRKIKLIDVDNKLLYERQTEKNIDNVPRWFIDNLHIKAPVAYANVSAGWNQVGMLSVQSDEAFAYQQLYDILIRLLISFSIISLVALIILYIILHAILKPLNLIQKQAEAVIKNKFIIQDKIPYTKEFKDVVLGMNNMVSKVKIMFEKGNEELRRQKELEYIDKTTKLKNRKYFIDKLPEYLKIDASSKGGVNMLICLSGIIEANEHIGRERVNNLFIDIAKIFKNSTNIFKTSIVSRMNGTEFSIFIPDCSEKQGLDIANNIYISCKQTINLYGLDFAETFISIGIYIYNYKENIGELLSHTDNALAQAKFIDKHIHIDRAGDVVEVMGKEAWKIIINDAILKNNFSFNSYKTVDVKKKKIFHNALSLTLKVDDKTTYNYGQFMALANQTGLSKNIYDNIIEKIFKTPDETMSWSICSLRLPYDYLILKDTYEKMAELFKNYALKLPFKLIIEMPDKLVSQNSLIIKQYKYIFEEYSIGMGIFEFIGESIDYHYLQDLRPVYIKGEASYFLTQNDQSLSALRLITDTVGISIIAVGVTDKGTLDRLSKKDIFIVQGRVTESIEL